MATTLVRHAATTAIRFPVANLPETEAPYVRAVVEAVRICPAPDSWRKKDLLRGRVAPLVGLFALFRDLRRGGSTPAQIEGANVALYNAIRAMATEGLAPINETLAEALRREQEAEGK